MIETERMLKDFCQQFHQKQDQMEHDIAEFVKKKVIILDSDKEYCVQMASKLREKGEHVITTNSSFKFVKLVALNNTKAVIISLNMSGTSLAELVKMIDPSPCKKIFSSTEEIREEQKAPGSIYYKNQGPDILLGLINS